jgi:hypothetical protein
MYALSYEDQLSITAVDPPPLAVAPVFPIWGIAARLPRIG